jgi:hypothetical protein
VTLDGESLDELQVPDALLPPDHAQRVERAALLILGTVADPVKSARVMVELLLDEQLEPTYRAAVVGEALAAVFAYVVEAGNPLQVVMFSRQLPQLVIEYRRARNAARSAGQAPGSVSQTDPHSGHAQ